MRRNAAKTAHKCPEVSVPIDCIVVRLFGKADGEAANPGASASVQEYRSPIISGAKRGAIDSMMNITLQLSFRIALVWAAGFLIAVAVQALLPDQTGINLTGKDSVLFIPFSRMGFWTCVLAALIVTALVVGRSMLADIGWSTFH